MATPPIPLKDRGWSGDAAVIVGGGPSLRDFRWESLFGVQHAIAINRAYQNVPYAEMFFTEDARVIKKFGHRADWKEFRGKKILHLLDDAYLPDLVGFTDDLIMVKQTKSHKRWSMSWDDGLSVSSNSAVGAFNIASIMGVKTIFALGLDCRSDGPTGQNYHDDYPKSWRPGPAQLADYASDFEHWVALHMRLLGIKVWNVINPKFPSALTCWPQIAYEDFYRMMKGLQPREVRVHFERETEVRFEF